MGKKDEIHIHSRSISDLSSPTLTPANEVLNPFTALTLIIQEYVADGVSEFFGTFIFLLFAFGVTAQVTLSKGLVGDYTLLCFGWAMGIMLGAYTASRSGGHLNPSVTLVLATLRSFSWKKVPVYVLSQITGAFCAAAVVYGNYRAAIDQFEGAGIRTVPGFSNHSTAGIFATFPASFMSTSGAFFSEFLASAILMFCIFALSDRKLDLGNLFPLCLAGVFIGISACFGWETGFAINQARDLGPRLFLSMVGYGKEVWSARNYYFWIPSIAPVFGCMFGGLLYDIALNDAENSRIHKRTVCSIWFQRNKIRSSHQEIV